MTIHTVHAQKHFSPETKSKVRPKKKLAQAGRIWNHFRLSGRKRFCTCAVGIVMVTNEVNNPLHA